MKDYLLALIRCIGSLDIENFFGSFQDYDPWGSGVLRPDSIPTASVAAELIDARLNPERQVLAHTHTHVERETSYGIE